MGKARMIEFNGIKKTITAWAKELGVDRSTIQKRLDVHKWSVEEALTIEHGNKRFIEFNKQKKTLSEWSKLTGLSSCVISSRIDELGWSVKDALTKASGSTRGKKKKIIFSQEDIDIIIDRHVNKHETACMIARKYNYSRPVINRILVEQKVYHPIGTRKYFFNEDYFAKIDTPRKAYWLGLFYADACVSENYTFSLGFKREDRYILETLAGDVGYNGDVHDYEQVKSIKCGPVKAYPSSIITLCSKKFFFHLNDKGMVVNKTFRLKFPNFANDLRRHFVRGLFDGDGYISFSKRTDNGRTSICFGIVGQEELLGAVNEVIAEEVKILPATVTRKADENCWALQYATSVGNNVRKFDVSRLDDILAIREWLYKDACIYFARKKKCFDSIRQIPKRTGMSMEEAAKHIGINARSIRRYIKGKHLASYKQGNYRRLRLEDVEEFKQLWETLDIMPWDKRLKHIGCL